MFAELTTRRIRQLAQEGWFPPAVRALYDHDKSISGMMRYYRERIAKAKDSLKDEQRKYITARREKTELETAILDEEYLKRSEVGPIVRQVANHQRAALQQKLENELPPKLAGLDPVQIGIRLKAVVDEVCKIHQESLAKWVEQK